MKVWINILELLILLKSIIKVQLLTHYIITKNHATNGLSAAQKLEFSMAHSPIGRLTLAKQTFFCEKKSRLFRIISSSEILRDAENFKGNFAHDEVFAPAIAKTRLAL